MYGGLVMPTRSIAEPSDGSSATRALKRVGRSVPMSRPEEGGLVFVNGSIVRWVSAPRRQYHSEYISKRLQVQCKDRVAIVNESIVRWLSAPRWITWNGKAEEGKLSDAYFGLASRARRR